MTAAQFALQVAAIGSGELGVTVVHVLAWVIVVIFALAVLWVLWGRAVMQDYPHRYEAAPLAADEPGEEDCPWCTDRTCDDPRACTCGEPCWKSYCGKRAVVRPTVADAIRAFDKEVGRG